MHLCLILRRATPLLPSKNPKLNQKSMEDGNSGSFNPSPLCVQFKAFSDKYLEFYPSSLTGSWWNEECSWPTAASSSHRVYQKGLCTYGLMPRSKGLGNPLPTSTSSLPMWDVKPEWKSGQRWEVKLLPPPQIRKRRAPTCSTVGRHPAPTGMVQAFWGPGVLSLDNSEGEK